MRSVGGRLKTDRDDRNLVSAYLRSREEQAFRALYRRHAPVVYRLILRLTGGHAEDAEEVLQAAWIRAAERLDRFRWESTLRSWLSGIAINCYREFARGRNRPEIAGPWEEPVLRGPHREIPRIDLERAIARLPDGYREVLILHDIEGYTHDEIGALMGIRNGTSKSQLSRARKAVRSWLSQTEENGDERRAV
jgi:RNA polymerase sigma-70 factor (ECF subfamily)